MNQTIINSLMPSEILKLARHFDEIKKKNTMCSVVSFDFDDTLYDNTYMFSNRINVFRNLMKSDHIFSLIVTARQKVERIIEIKEFCEHHNIAQYLPFIVYNARNKDVILDILKIDMHFDDDISSTINITNKKIPVMFMGEFLNSEIVKIWTESLEEKNISQYYNLDDKQKIIIV